MFTFTTYAYVFGNFGRSHGQNNGCNIDCYGSALIAKCRAYYNNLINILENTYNS